MSKILKSLKKAKEGKADFSVHHEYEQEEEVRSSVHPQLVVDQQSINCDVPENEDNPVIQRDDFVERNKNARFLNANLAMGVVSLVGLLAVIALVVSFTSLREIRVNKSASMNIIKDYGIAREKAIELEKKILELEEISRKIPAFQEGIQRNKAKVEEIFDNHDITKQAVKDLKTSDRLILDKIISLNKQLIKINSNIVK